VPFPTFRRLATIAAAAALALLAIAPAAHAATWSLLDASTPIANPAADDPERVEVGVKFKVATPPAGREYRMYNVRFYRAPAHAMDESRVFVYDDTGRQIATGDACCGPPRSGVVQAFIQGGVTLRPGATYTVSYLADGYYAEQQHGFDAPRTVGPVTFPESAGVYQYGGGLPESSWEGSNYYVSPVVEDYPVDTSTPPPAPSSWTLLDASTRIAVPEDTDPDRVEVGVKFGVAEPPAGKDYYLEKVLFYRAPQAAMVENHAYVYDEDGTQIAHHATIGEGGAYGIVPVWMGFSGGIKLRPGETYTVSYRADGHYATELHAFDEPKTVGPITFPEGAGVYQYGGGFPTSTWENSGYYVSPFVTLR
jgi:hypothetical protein